MVYFHFIHHSVLQLPALYQPYDIPPPDTAVWTAHAVAALVMAASVAAVAVLVMAASVAAVAVLAASAGPGTPDIPLPSSHRQLWYRRACHEPHVFLYQFR